MSDQATAESAFFRVLPPEVRTAILTAAFGGGTIHIQPCQAAAELEAQARASKPRGPIGAARNWLRGLVADRTRGKRGPTKPDQQRPAARWCGRVCEELRDHRGSPVDEDCLGIREQSALGSRCSCASEPEFAVGATGWLLTCRRAYDEGFKVLYSSNTFHVRIHSLCVFGQFVPQFPASVLSCITSVEFIIERMAITVKQYDALPESDRSEEDMLNRTLSLVPRLMPSLQKLYVGFQMDTCLLEGCQYKQELYYECAKPIMSAMNTLARELVRLGMRCDLELGLPMTPYMKYLEDVDRCGRPDWKPGMPSRFSYHHRLRYFRPVQGRRPEADLGTGEERGPDIGIWISESAYDLVGVPNRNMCRCFGT